MWHRLVLRTWSSKGGGLHAEEVARPFFSERAAPGVGEGPICRSLTSPVYESMLQRQLNYTGVSLGQHPVHWPRGLKGP